MAMGMYYLDDLVAGQRFVGSARIRIEEDRIKAFASEFDPQAFHLDEGAASASIYDPVTSCEWRAKCWKCGRRSRGRSKDW